MHPSTQHLLKKPSYEDDSLSQERGRQWHPATDHDVITQPQNRRDYVREVWVIENMKLLY